MRSSARPHARRAVEIPGEARAEESVDDEIRLVEGCSSAAVDRTLPVPAASAASPVSRSGRPEKAEAHLIALLGQKARCDEAVAAVLAGPAATRSARPRETHFSAASATARPARRMSSMPGIPLRWSAASACFISGGSERVQGLSWRAKWRCFRGHLARFRNCTNFEQKMPYRAAKCARICRRSHGRLLRAGAKSGKTSNRNG